MFVSRHNLLMEFWSRDMQLFFWFSIVAVHSHWLLNMLASFVVCVVRARTISVRCPICGIRVGCLNISFVSV